MTEQTKRLAKRCGWKTPRRRANANGGLRGAADLHTALDRLRPRRKMRSRGGRQKAEKGRRIKPGLQKQVKSGRKLSAK